MPASSRPPAWLMIGAGMLVTLLVVVCARLAYGLILPSMREGLGLSYQAAGNLGTITALGYLCLVMVAGAAAARWGSRRTVLLGVMLATVGFAGLSVASDYLLLMGLMALLGVGTAFSYTPVISLLSRWFPDRRGAVIGFLNGGVGLGLVGAGLLVPYLNQAFGADGWRVAWAVFAGLGLLVLLAGLWLLRDPPPVAAEAEGTAGGASVYRNRYVLVVGLTYGVVGLTYIVQAIFMFSFAVESGVALQTAGRLAALMGVLSVLSGPLWGALSDRWGRANALLLSMTLLLIGTAIPVLWPVLVSFTAHYLIMGLTVTGLFTSILAASTERVGAAEAPLAVSFVTLFFAAGQLAGPAAAGLLIDWSGGFRLAFAASLVVMLLGVGLGAYLRTLHRRPEPARLVPA